MKFSTKKSIAVAIPLLIMIGSIFAPAIILRILFIIGSIVAIMIMVNEK